MWVMWNLVSICLETVLVSVQGLWQKYHGSEIILALQMVLLGDEAQVEVRFGPFGDTANLDSR